MIRSILSGIMLLLISCTMNQTEKESIGEMEFYFDERLTSISEGKDGKLWIGSETGDVFLFDNGNRKPYDLQGSRIYKVIFDVSAQGDSVLWVGMRNAGLQVWRIGKNNQVEKIKTYSIEGKDRAYSPYDFAFYRGSTFVCTSNGLYRIPENRDKEELELVYPSAERLKSDREFSVHNLCFRDDNTILTSTSHGLLEYDVVTENGKMLLEGKWVSHVSLYHDTIFAVSGNYIYSFTKGQDKPHDSIKTENAPVIYYRDPKGNHFMVAPQHVIVGKNLKNIPVNSVEINLRRTIPLESRNIILPDTVNNYTYMLTENALWKIPNNMNIYQSGRIMKAACAGTDGSLLYVTSKNELYRQDRGKDKAVRLCRIDIEGSIEWIDSYKNDLYLCSSENVLYQMPVSSGWFENVAPKEIFRSSGNINAVYLDQEQDHQVSLFAGTRKGLFRVEEKGFFSAGEKNIDTIAVLKNKYITSIFHNPDPDNDKLLYVGTLNDGIWYATGDKYTNFKQLQDIDHPFVTSIIASNRESLNQVTVLTNQHILCQNADSSVRAKGFQKLIYVNDSSFFALPSRGVEEYRIQNRKISLLSSHYRDIRFEPNATLMVRGKLMLGSDLGSMLVDPDNLNKPVWVNFEDPVAPGKIMAMTVLILLFLAVGAYALWQKWSKNREVRNKTREIEMARVQESRDSLKRRIEDLVSLTGIFGPDSTESGEILKIFRQFEEFGKVKDPEQVQLDQFSKEIAFLNRRIGVRLITLFEEQIQELGNIKCKEAARLLKISSDLKDTNRFDQIRVQFEQNASWMKRRVEMLATLREYREQIIKYPVIPEITDGLLPGIDDLFRKMNQQDLPGSEKELQQLSDVIGQLGSDQARVKIMQYVQGSLKNKVTQEMTGYDTVCRVISKFEEFAGTCPDNGCLLEKLFTIEIQIAIARSLDKIREMYGTKIKMLAENRNEKCNISNEINMLYEKLPEEEREFLHENLDLSIHVQSAKILVVLMTDRNVKRAHIGEILDISGNVSPAVTKLIKKLVANEKLLFEKLQASDEYSVFLKQLEIAIFKDNGQVWLKS
jgi:ligand-binding sensor domain-containing protein